MTAPSPHSQPKIEGLLERLEASQKACFDAGQHIAAMDIQTARADIATLRARVEVLTKGLSAAAGYLRNASIDLSTGCTKATAIKTIEGGLKVVEAALVLKDRAALNTGEGEKS